MLVYCGACQVAWNEKVLGDYCEYCGKSYLTGSPDPLRKFIDYTEGPR